MRKEALWLAGPVLATVCWLLATPARLGAG